MDPSFGHVGLFFLLTMKAPFMLIRTSKTEITTNGALIVLDIRSHVRKWNAGLKSIWTILALLGFSDIKDMAVG